MGTTLKLPEKLLQSLNGIPGFNAPAFEETHLSGQQVVSIRLNPNRLIAEDLFTGMQKIPWSRDGYYLSERPSFTFDPRFHAGAYYVQEASSMFLEQVLVQHQQPETTIRALDLCAAPGGKSTLIQSLISRQSFLVSNEVIRSRAQILEENLTKWGAANVLVTNNDPRDFSSIENYFDLVLVDAPCSGSGLFRRDPHLISEWNEDLVQLCYQRQQRILADILPAIASDGLLIYATCSYSREENEDIMDWLTKEFDLENLSLKIEASWNIIETESKGKNKGYRFFPDKLKGEGFFICCFRKRNGMVRKESPVKRNRLSKSSVTIEKLQPFVKASTDLKFVSFGDRILALPPELEEQLSFLQKHLYIRKAGISVGRPSPKGLIPDHELALSDLIGDDLVEIPLNLKDALQYLRKEAVILDGLPPGWALVSYQGYRLGWIKLLGRRINNYYPQAWRILKSPDL